MGENSVDLVVELDRYPTPDSKHQLRSFRELPGGEAASAAVGLARLGHRVAYVGRFGGDAFGDTGRRRLGEEGVDLRHVVVVNGSAQALGSSAEEIDHAIEATDAATSGRRVPVAFWNYGDSVIIETGGAPAGAAVKDATIWLARKRRAGPGQ